jgi:uncharacterized protein YutE (UPF0331/DUF86 family)
LLALNEALVDLQRGRTPPESARAAFVMLARHSVIERELAERLGHASGLRNVLVHDHVSVDLRILAKVVCDDLGDLRAFGAAVGALLPRETPT